MEVSNIKFFPLLFTVLSISISSTTLVTSASDGFLQCFFSNIHRSDPINDVIFVKNSSAYTSLLQSSLRNLRFSKTSTPKPEFIITPYHETHVQTSVTCAKENSMQIRVKSGGHDYEGLSYVAIGTPFVVLDVVNFRSISVDMNTETAWVEAGATLGELYYKIAEQSNVHGFPAADNVVDAKLVDINGRVLNRQTMGEDLFWAIRGGGAEQLVTLMQENFPELGLELSHCTEMSWIQSVLYFAGFSIKEPLNVLLNRTATSTSFFKAKSDYVRAPISESGLEGLWQRMLEDETSLLIFSPYGGKMSEISDSEIPFPHRKGNLYLIQYLSVWAVENETEDHIAWMRRLYDYMEPYVSQSPRAAYFNYRDLDLGTNNCGGDNNTSYEQASSWGLRYFMHNFERLVRVKTMIDPLNFFSNEQSIPALPSQGITKGLRRSKVIACLILIRPSINCFIDAN
ncbi:hypothetical protein FNV43_RR06492 [Rhamnella rubrinervis]|uniref:FAD-binding PCMH-type domain-containing protein n=1 Tax=Rhamnella rubrinervis TaxID=2594499 RepID=A0A8K0MLC4_9ROSA|nr:hypothetical protein FNV43_RR06492 [Rhamnella rubrinervis]